jgi:hypothetical protein
MRTAAWEVWEWVEPKSVVTNGVKTWETASYELVMNCVYTPSTEPHPSSSKCMWGVLGVGDLWRCGCELHPEEWALLETSQKLYKDVMLETFRSLAAIGKDSTIPSLCHSESKCFWVISTVGWFGLWRAPLWWIEQQARWLYARNVSGI